MGVSKTDLTNIQEDRRLGVGCFSAIPGSGEQIDVLQQGIKPKVHLALVQEIDINTSIVSKEDIEPKAEELFEVYCGCGCGRYLSECGRKDQAY